ncbi:MAG: nucleotidyltransferase domain-containing protein [Candidatus Thorarchaeota archaeon]
MTIDEKLVAHYNMVLDEFLERVEKDSNIIAAILFGSLVNGNVWEESDIDLILISKDATKPFSDYWLVDGNILIQVYIESRQFFRQSVERALDSSLMSHLLSTSRILFSKDESLTRYIQNAVSIGQRDKQLQLMRLAMYLDGEFVKVRKSLQIYNDHIMAYRFLLNAIDSIARLEIIFNDQIPGREYLQQALQINPELFKKVYTDILDEGVTRESVEMVNQILVDYTKEKTLDFFRPILDFLIDEGGHCGISRIDAYFNKKLGMPQGNTLIGVCEWLANEGVIQRMPKPVHLTSRSREPEMEAAYYFSEDELL